MSQIRKYIEILSEFSFKTLTYDDPSIQHLRQLAANDKYLGDIVNDRITAHIVLYKNNLPIAFAVPRQDTDGRYRSGPIFVHPNHRNEQAGKRLLNYIFNHKSGRAFIEKDNTASKALF